MGDAEALVAVHLRVGDHAKPDRVVDLLERALGALHLLVDRPQVLGATHHLAGDAVLAHLLRDQLLDRVDVLQPLGSALRDVGGELLVLARVHVLEREVLELDLDPLDPEPVREGRVDLHRLGRDALLLLRREVAERAHVVEAIAQLDQDDADIARHREQHLAEVLRLLLLARGVRQLAELRHALDEERDLLAE